MRGSVGNHLGHWRQWAVAMGALAAVAVTSAAATRGASPVHASGAPSVELETATVATLDQLLDSHKISSVALTRAYLDRISSVNSRAPSLNAVRVINPDALREVAAADGILASGKPHGPLEGIPVIVKDNIDVAGLPTTAGSVALADSFPAGDAPLVTDLRRAGAIILAKANLSEFANFLTNNMPSSSGSAVSAAVGFAPLTVGTETSGLILSPAAANSDVGIKPTVGLIPRTGIVPIAARTPPGRSPRRWLTPRRNSLRSRHRPARSGNQRQPARRPRLHDGPRPRRAFRRSDRSRRQPGALGQ